MQTAQNLSQQTIKQTIQPSNQQEQPLYVLPQSLPRTIIPKLSSLIILSATFYLGILINIYLLELDESLKQNIRLISFIIISLIVIIGIISAMVKARKRYYFYRSKISFGKKFILYSDIHNTIPHQDLLDKIFRTYSINLGEKFFLR